MFGAQQQQPSIFGQPQQQPAAAGGGGGGLFGQQQQQQPASGGTSLFGQPQPAAGGGGGLFGQQQQPAAGGGGLFGQQQPATGGGLFGQQQPSSGGTSLFGQQQQPATGGTSLFGQQQQPATGGTSLFGQPQQQQPAAGGGGLFGQQQPSAGGGLFGQQQQPATGGGLFGQQPATGGGLFGQQPATGGGLFGQQPATGGGLFGQPQQPSIFPQTQQQQLQQQFMSPMDQAVHRAEVSGPYWYRELVGIQAAYRICRFNKFQTLLYETIPPNAPAVGFKQARQRLFFQNLPWLDEREWQRMEENNPDAARLNPTPIVGIDMLEKRVKRQIANSKDQLAQSLDWIESCQQNLQVIRERVSAAKRRYVELHSKLIACLGRLERLQARTLVAGPRTPSELAFRTKLEEVKQAVNHPSNGLFTKLMQLDAGMLSLTAKQQQQQQGEEESTMGLLPAADVERRNELILAFLEEQTKSLALVMDVLRRDAREVKLIKAKLSSSS